MSRNLQPRRLASSTITIKPGRVLQRTAPLYLKLIVDACPSGVIVLDDSRDRFNSFVLDAQIQVIPFYERLGFVAEGDVFLDAGIEHRRMRLSAEPGAPPGP